MPCRCEVCAGDLLLGMGKVHFFGREGECPPKVYDSMMVNVIYLRFASFKYLKTKVTGKKHNHVLDNY